MAEEYLRVEYKLWNSSWRDDAVVLDKKRGVYTEPDRVRRINHDGKYYKVPGPHICQPSPQRTPLLLQAGTSKAGKTFAAQHAEAIFVAGHSPAVIAKNVAEIRQMAKDDFGRDPRSVKFLALICPIIGNTEEEARKKFEDYESYGSIEGALALFGGWTGIDMASYDDEQELRHVESNAIRSAVEGWSKASPGVKKWTKLTVAKVTVAPVFLLRQVLTLVLAYHRRRFRRQRCWHACSNRRRISALGRRGRRRWFQYRLRDQTRNFCRCDRASGSGAP